MAGTVTEQQRVIRSFPDTQKKVTIVTLDWTADAADGSVPNTTVAGLYGYLIKAITNPGSVAPTDNYDIKLLEPLDNTADACADTLLNRDTANTEVAYPCVSGSATPPFFTGGDYILNITGNAVNSATGRIILFFSEQL